MTLNDINTKITSLTGADTNQYPNSQRVVDMNIWLQKIAGMIYDSQDETDYDDPRYTDIPVLTVPLTTDRRYNINQTENVLSIKDLSVTYDGTNYYRATPIDQGDITFGNATSTATTQNATIDAYFSRTSPRYDIKYNLLFLYPSATSTDVANGGQLLIEWDRTPVEFTEADLSSTSIIPGIDLTFQAMLAYGPALEYCLPRQLPQTNNIKTMLDDYELRLRKQYSSKQKDRKHQFKSDYQNYK